MRLAQLCAERQCSNFIAGWTGARQLAGRVFCHFADASANCDYVTPLKSTSIIIIYDVITRWHRAGRNSRRKRRRKRRRRKTCTNQLLLMFSRPTCRIRNVRERVSKSALSFTCCAYDMSHGTPWSDFGKSFFLLMHLTWLLIKLTHTLPADVCVASKVILLLNPAI